jgi:hypothetical protein
MSLPGKRVPRGLVLATVLLAGLGHAGCDTSFEPFQESDHYFSVFGYLDASADTQYVRVTPLRNSLVATAGPLDATVTLEDLASGRRTVLRDSAFVFGGRAAVHNYWTTEDVLPGAAYRLTVTRSDGAATTATIRIPDTFPDPQVVAEPFRPIVIRARGVERLADIRMVYRLLERFSGRRATYEVSYLTDASRTAEAFVVFLNTERDFQQIQTRYGQGVQIESAHVVVGAAGPDWPDLTEIDLETLALADVVSNVEHGVGFVGGVFTKRAPVF